MEIKNVGQLRKIIENLSDDYEIEMRVRRKLSDDEADDICSDWQVNYYDIAKKVLKELKNE